MRRNLTGIDRQRRSLERSRSWRRARYAHNSSHAARKGRRRKKLGLQYPRPILPPSRRAREPEFQPNVRALRGILVALAVTAFFCFCVAIALLPGLHTKPMAVASPRCTCRQPAALPWRRKDKTVSSQTSTLIDINELSKRLSIPKGTIYNWVYLPRIPYVKAGRSLRFDPDDVIRSLPH